MSDRRDGVPTTVTSIPLVDPHAPKADPSIGDLVKDATTQVSTLVRAEVELAKAEITRDVKKGLTGSVFFILALVVLFYSTFFFFFFLAELLDTWLWRWVAFLIVFGIMVLATAVLALFGYLKVRRIRGPQQTIESVKETREALTPGHDKDKALTSPNGQAALTRPPIRRAGNGPTRPVGGAHRRSLAPSRGARQRDSLSRRGGGVEGHGTGLNVAAKAAPVTDRPLVILLHGFGSFWWSWRHQLRGLTGARVVAVDLRGYGGSDKPPRGYDGWTLAGDTAGLVRALGHKAATLVGHADGGLVCWATSVLHPRMVRAIAVVSSPHPVALRASALTRRDQGRALLPWMLRYQVPMWPERSLTRNDAEELERLVRSRASGKWLASEDFSETIRHMRRAIQIPSAAHSALEYQRWAVRSQLRGEGRRFMRSMKRPLAVPVLHLRGDADPYVLADPVYRTQHYAPQGRYVSIAGAGHFGHEEAPEVVNEQLSRFLAQVYG